MLDTQARVAPRNRQFRRLAMAAARAVTTRTLSSRAAMAVWCVTIAAGFAFSLFGRGLLPARFSYDAAHIARIAQDGLTAGKGDQSFIAVGELYNVLGLEDQPLLLAGLSFAVIGLLNTLVLLRLRSAGRVTVVGIAALMVSTGIGAVYLTTYAKDTVVLAVVAVCLLASKRLVGEVQLLAAIAVYAACFRSYWALVLLIYVAIRLWDRFLRWHRLGLLVPVGAIVVVALAYAAVTGQPLDGARTLANSIRLDSPDARTMISAWVALPSPWGSAVNILITLVLLVVPVPLVALGSPYYLAIAVLLLALWGGVVLAWLFRVHPLHGGLATRCLALLLAFLATQAVFEPDYGSALRHLSPLLPLLAAGIGLVLRDRTRTAVPARAIAPRGRHSA